MSRYKLYTDGSHIVYQNVAGFGGYIEDQKGNEVINFFEIIPDKKFMAKHELIGLIHGLEKALSLGIKNLDCFSDCLSLVKILNSKNQQIVEKYVAKEPLLIKAIDLMDSFENITLSHIFRQNNKKADKLARKATLSANVTTTQIVENSFKVKSLISSNQYLKNEKKEFNKIKEGIEDYLVFNAVSSGNSGNGFILQTFKAREDKVTKKVDYEIIGTEQLPRSKWIPKTFEIIGKALEDTKLKNINICVLTGHLKQIDFTLRGLESVKSNYPSLKYLKKIMENFDKVIVHNNINVIDTIFPKDIDNKLPINKENLIHAMKVIGEHDYILGSDTRVENMIPMSDFKKGNLVELQKKFFGEFIKIGMYKFENNPLYLQVENREQQLKEVREDLISKGVVFRY